MRTLTWRRGVRPSWTSADIDSCLVLLEMGAADPARRVTRARRSHPMRCACRVVLRSVVGRRVVVLAVVAYAIPLYAVEALLDQVRGVPCGWPWLERRLDRASDRFASAEVACNKAGDVRFMERVKAATDRLEDAVLWATARLARH
jgi:hypothetical protein